MDGWREGSSSLFRVSLTSYQHAVFNNNCSCETVTLKVFVPNKLLDCLPRSACLPNERLRWNTNETCSRSVSVV
uniref:Calmodulin binding transcription activator 1 n=1 Tax=Poecilia latipinna TaxID=48699 RepID=A0A3B3TQY6_9TELE